jgi:hypothetical protein
LTVELVVPEQVESLVVELLVVELLVVELLVVELLVVELLVEQQPEQLGQGQVGSCDFPSVSSLIE